MAGLAGQDPGPWTFGELLELAEGRKKVNRHLAGEVWRLLLGSSSEPKRVEVSGDAAAAVWSRADAFLKKGWVK